MRFTETVTQLNETISDMGISLGGYIITSYSAVEVENVGIVSDVSVIFPVGRNYHDSAQTHLANNMPVFQEIEYCERFNSVTNPVALGGIEFHFTWVDSSGGN